jgi:hypothetical protein
MPADSVPAATPPEGGERLGAPSVQAGLARGRALQGSPVASRTRSRSANAAGTHQQQALTAAAPSAETSLSSMSTADMMAELQRRQQAGQATAAALEQAAAAAAVEAANREAIRAVASSTAAAAWVEQQQLPFATPQQRPGLGTQWEPQAAPEQTGGHGITEQQFSQLAQLLQRAVLGAADSSHPLALGEPPQEDAGCGSAASFRSCREDQGGSAQRRSRNTGGPGRDHTGSRGHNRSHSRSGSRSSSGSRNRSGSRSSSGSRSRSGSRIRNHGHYKVPHGAWQRVAAGVPAFTGERQPDSMAAAEWTDTHVLQLARLHLRVPEQCALSRADGQQLVELAASKLQGDAQQWWQGMRGSQGDWRKAYPAWEAFADRLQQRFPPTPDTRRLTLLQQLVQGTASVAEYCSVAMRIDARLTPAVVTKPGRVMAFLQGLDTSTPEGKELVREAYTAFHTAGGEWGMAEVVDHVRLRAECAQDARDLAARQQAAQQPQQQRAAGGRGAGRWGGGGWAAGGRGAGSGGQPPAGINAIGAQLPGVDGFTGCYACGLADHVVRDCTNQEAKAAYNAARHNRQRPGQQQGDGGRPRGGA